ncbi:MAG: S1 RNA-binding domain-containing protein, partial [Actinomycetes bacterium]
ITKFGAFVNILPGRDGLLHISRLDGSKRVERVEDYLAEGDIVRVRVREIERGKVSLELVEALPGATLPDPDQGAPKREDRGGRGGDRGDRGGRGGDRGDRGGRDRGDRGGRDRGERQGSGGNGGNGGNKRRRPARSFDEAFGFGSND